MRWAIFILAAGLFAGQSVFSSSLQVGASYEEVIRTLGKPDGELDAGSRKILAYGKAQIKLKDGKVTSISPELTTLLAERDSDQESVEAKRAAGLVNYKGKWMRPSEQRDLVIREQGEKASKAASAAASNGGWLTNYDQALALAKKEKKKVLLNFTGSDWCGWCVRLDEEVFSKKQFVDYAREHYVLVKLDFPRRSKLPADLKKQNDRLAKKYKVRGFPTVVVLNSNGKKHTTGGYVAGGPKAFLRSIK